MNLEGRTVRVTRDNIRKGIPGSASCCPIAKALRKVANKKRVQVDTDYITVGNMTYFTPPDACEFIMDFDERERVDPFTFTIKEVLY